MPLPTQGDFLEPTLEAFRRQGSLRNAEVDRFLIEALQLAPEDVDAVGHKGRPALEIKRNLAISQLYGMGFIEQSERGVYSITETGREADKSDIEAQRRLWNRLKARRSKDSGQVALEAATEDAHDSDEPEVAEDGWKSEVIKRVVGLSPRSFERLVRDLLLEAGFAKADITQHGSDGGIDGTGEYSSGLTTQAVVFQAKKFDPAHSVSANYVRNLQGVLGMDPDVRGLLITTSSFTSDAKAAAAEPGTRRIQLIDGYQLCDLMLQYEVGVTRIPSIDENLLTKYETDSVNDGHSERFSLDL